jgi:putative hydrolase of the HAD superfamily
MTGLALFDLDNTLCDRDGCFDRWVDVFCAEHGLARAEVDGWLAEFDVRGDRPPVEFFAAVCARTGLAGPPAQLWDQWRADYVGAYSATPGTLDGIAAMRSAGWRVGIITDGGSDVQLGKLRSTGLDRIVDGYVISGVEGMAKPHPELFRRAAAACSVSIADIPPERRFMVGDMPVPDVGGSILAGLRPIWLAHGRDWIEPAYAPEHQVEEILDAMEIIGAG